MEKGELFYTDMSNDKLLHLKVELEKRYKELQSMEIKIDMTKGKPSRRQLDLSMGMMKTLDISSNYISEDGRDCRNYGGLDGIFEAKKLISEILNVSPENIIVGGNSSCNLMFDLISNAMTKGVMRNIPWNKQGTIKFLCPVPGFDKHFMINEYFGIKMLSIPMLPSGPDMDLVEKLVSNDASIKGIWCVPKYSNPQGIVYSDETVERLAQLRPMAEDFRIYWDNAYCVHDLYETQHNHLKEILKACDNAGNADMVYVFMSTSKMTFPGAGIAAIASSANNLREIRKMISIQTIGSDKLNQLRHVRYFNNIDGIKKHMKSQAEIVRPKFEMVLDILEHELAGLGVGAWTKPKGGYFISFDAMEGCAKAIIEKAKMAGVIMSAAGSTYPYGQDPNDSNIRIAPTYPECNQLRQAIEIFSICVKLVSIDKLLQRNKNNV